MHLLLHLHLHPEDVGHQAGHPQHRDPEAGEGGVDQQQALHLNKQLVVHLHRGGDLLEGGVAPEDRVGEADEAGAELDVGAGDE
jgi:hypothetical protein